jgi:putative tryptophan/tyrosine transport system substrate-binding protein
VAVLGNEANPSDGLDFKNVETAASTMGVTLRHIEVRSPSDFESAFSKMTSARANALFLLADTMFQNNGRRLADLATKSRLPTIYDGTELPEAGILMSYGANRSDLYRRAATFVDKILKRRQARRLASRAAEKVRAGDKFEGGQPDRPHDPAECAGESGSSD